MTGGQDAAAKDAAEAAESARLERLANIASAVGTNMVPAFPAEGNATLGAEPLGPQPKPLALGARSSGSAPQEQGLAAGHEAPNLCAAGAGLAAISPGIFAGRRSAGRRAGHARRHRIRKSSSSGDSGSDSRSASPPRRHHRTGYGQSDYMLAGVYMPPLNPALLQEAIQKALATMPGPNPLLSLSEVHAQRRELSAVQAQMAVATAALAAGGNGSAPTAGMTVMPVVPPADSGPITISGTDPVGTAIDATIGIYRPPAEGVGVAVQHLAIFPALPSLALMSLHRHRCRWCRHHQATYTLSRPPRATRSSRLTALPLETRGPQAPSPLLSRPSHSRLRTTTTSSHTTSPGFKTSGSRWPSSLTRRRR